MLGAIIGDVAGSNYEVLEVRHLKANGCNRSYEERIKILDKSTPLFTEDSSVTDDSILTCAIYEAIRDGNFEYEDYLRLWGNKELERGKDQYGRSRFGKGFVKWLEGKTQGDSYGNGAAMRISPVGFCFDQLEVVKEHARLATIPSHNHEDAIKGAEAVAVAIYLLRNGMSKKEVVDYIKENYYDLNFNLEDLRHNYTFSSITINSVPQALYIFSISTDFEDAIRKALSIGGDSDTITAIVGGLSEACYGIPEDIKEGVKPYLTNEMIELLRDTYFKKNNEFKKGVLYGF